MFAYSLKNRLTDELKAKKILSYAEVLKLALKSGCKEITAIRRLQAENGEALPIIKLNSRGKPIKGSEAWSFVKWVGARTVFKKK